MPRLPCVVCGQTNDNFKCKSCAGCGGPHYCSTACQAYHWYYDGVNWPKHKDECPFHVSRTALLNRLPKPIVNDILKSAYPKKKPNLRMASRGEVGEARVKSG